VIARAAGELRARVGRRQGPATPLEAGTMATFRVLGDVAHDLGGPITGVVAAIDAMLEPGGPPSDGAEMLLEARAEALRLVELIRRRRESADVLRSGGGATSVDVRETLAAAVAALQTELRRAAIEVRSVPAAPHLSARVDPLRVRAIVTALLLNAIEASRRRSASIELRSSLSSLPGAAKILRIEVEDGGRGMSAEDVVRAGDLFHSLRRTGSGMGLASARHALAGMRGVLALESAPDGGTIAVVVAPVE
jgi:signal transduction histidine kinase